MVEGRLVPGTCRIFGGGLRARGRDRRSLERLIGKDTYIYICIYVYGFGKEYVMIFSTFEGIHRRKYGP